MEEEKPISSFITQLLQKIAWHMKEIYLNEEDELNNQMFESSKDN